MTEIATEVEAEIPLHPSDILMSLIVALLAPMFLCVSAGDIGMARMAAIETVNAYRARNYADLVAVAQIIAFGLAALGSLSLSMDDDISLSMTLRLRGNANALNRSAEQNRRALRESRHDGAATTQTPAMPTPSMPSIMDEDRNEFESFLTPEAEQQLASEAQARLQDPRDTVHQASIPLLRPNAAPTDAEKRNQAMWAIAMVKESGEIAASIPNLPPSERRAATIRAAALSGCANELLYGPPKRLNPDTAATSA
ncbi:MAG: hypothetical protein QOG25_3981 [Acetobacteraceae bacterium]|jgi:hypothetical protein|nr:hypothetical protein [Acetobacteraceae bacterium]